MGPSEFLRDFKYPFDRESGSYFLSQEHYNAWPYGLKRKSAVAMKHLHYQRKSIISKKFEKICDQRKRARMRFAKNQGKSKSFSYAHSQLKEVDLLDRCVLPMQLSIHGMGVARG